MREVVNIHIGQAGCQMSSAIWEQFCAEHNLDACGQLKDGYDTDNPGLDSFFCSMQSGQNVPRAVSIDLEPTVLDEIRSGQYRRLFHPNMLISGMEDASSNFARGHFTIGRFIINNVINQVRKIVQTCDALHGFIITSSYGGGTGSGFQTLLLERLAAEYSKYLKMSLIVYPSPTLSMSTVESYNAMLASNFTIDLSDLCVLFDNESSYRICSEFLAIENPNFSNLNKILAHIISSLTVSLRYESSLNSDLDQIITNLVPFPRIHFPILNAAPILSEEKSSHKSLSTDEITKMVFDSHNTLLKVNTLEGDYFCCSLQYRGKVTPRDANAAICEIKKHRNINFVDWCPTGFKVGLNCHPPLSIPSSGIHQSDLSVTMLANTSAIVQIFVNICRNFDILFQKRAFVHWFIGEGMEEGEFIETRDNMSYLISDYVGIHTSPHDEPINDLNEINNLEDLDVKLKSKESGENSFVNELGKQPSLNLYEMEDETKLKSQEEEVPAIPNKESNSYEISPQNEMKPKKKVLFSDEEKYSKESNEIEKEEDIINDLSLLNDDEVSP